MSEITLLKLVEAAMDAAHADGLWNGDGPCGCGRDDLAPCGGMQPTCVLAKSKIVAEGEDDECNAVGSTVWCPIDIKEAK